MQLFVFAIFLVFAFGVGVVYYNSCNNTSCPLDVPESPIPLFSNQQHFFDFYYQRYSSHRCFGGEQVDSTINWYKRHCVFRNLFLAQDDDDTSTNFYLVYFVHPALINQTLEDFPSSTTLNFFPLPLRFVFHAHKFFNGSTNAAVQADHCVIFADDRERTHLVGHDFDSVWNTFNSMVSTGMLSLNNSLVVIPRKRKKFVSSVPAKAWYTLSTRVHMIHAFPSGFLPLVLLCTNQQFVVTLPTFLNTLATTQYRARTLAVLNLEESINSSVPTLALHYKNYRHAFLDHANTFRALQLMYPRVKVVEFQAYRRTSLREEIAFMLSLDVYVTPGGGGSFFSIFIRKGGTVIYGRPCWPGRPRTRAKDVGRFGTYKEDVNGTEIYCFRQDNFVWTFFPYFHQRYIGATEVESIRFDPAPFVKPSKGVGPHDRLLAYSFRLNMTHLQRYVDEALLQSGFASCSVSGQGFDQTTAW